MSDVTQTQDTTGVVGNAADIPGGTQSQASVTDTTPTGGGGGGDNNKPANYLDTSGATGGENDHHGYEYGTVDQTIDTGSGGGSPIQHANPAYAPPPGDTPGTILDTTRTDSPVTGGGSETSTVVAGNLDTIDYRPALQTTNWDNLPVAPNAPTALAGDGSVLVSFATVADPVGAAVRGYRIEAVMLDGDNVTGADTDTSAAGVVFAGRNATSAVFGDVVPGSRYAFRVAATNDNGTGPYSDWSNVVVPSNALAIPADEITEANRVNPIYRPDGTFIPGTGSTPGPVQSPAVATGSGAAGSFDVTFTQSLYGSPASYDVLVYSDEERTTLEDTVNTTDLTGGVTVAVTGLTADTDYWVTIVGKNDNGEGVPVNAGPVTSVA